MSYLVQGFTQGRHDKPVFTTKYTTKHFAHKEVATIKRVTGVDYITLESDKAPLNIEWSRCKNDRPGHMVSILDDADLCGCIENGTPVHDGWHKTVHAGDC